MRIDFNNIYNQDKIILPKILNNLKKIIKKGNFILGNEVKNFEKNFLTRVNLENFFILSNFFSIKLYSIEFSQYSSIIKLCLKYFENSLIVETVIIGSKYWIFFETNNSQDFQKKLLESEINDNYVKIINGKKFSKQFSVFNHCKKLKELIL